MGSESTCDDGQDVVGGLAALGWQLCVAIGQALVSEPGLLEFQFVRVSTFVFFHEIRLENLVVRYRGKIIKVSWIGPGQNGGF